MTVDERVRQQGIGHALLWAVGAIALVNRINLKRTEVGAKITGAHQLYQQASDRGPFGAHWPSRHGIFLEKRIRLEVS